MSAQTLIKRFEAFRENASAGNLPTTYEWDLLPEENAVLLHNSDNDEVTRITFE